VTRIPQSTRNFTSANKTHIKRILLKCGVPNALFWIQIWIQLGHRILIIVMKEKQKMPNKIFEKIKNLDVLSGKNTRSFS
jgi:hypothetical protein